MMKLNRNNEDNMNYLTYSVINNNALPKRILLSFQYVALFLFIYWVTFGISNYDAYDLSRNLEKNQFYYDTYTVTELIEMRQESKIDFLYFLVNFVAIEYSIPLYVITAVTVFVFYCLIIKMMKILYCGRYAPFVIFAVLFITPLAWIVSISRNLMAYVFLYVAILLLYKKRWGWAMLFFVMSILTHVSVLIFIPLLIISFILRKKKIPQPMKPTLLILVTLLGFLLSNVMVSFFGYFLNDTAFNSYGSYKASNFLFAENVDIGTKAPTLFAYIYSLVLLLIHKKQGLEFWMLFVLTIFFSFSLNNDYNFIYRCMMFMPLIWGLNVAKIYSNSSSKDKKTLQLISIMAVMPIVLHFYSFRSIYFR